MEVDQSVNQAISLSVSDFKSKLQNLYV